MQRIVWTCALALGLLACGDDSGDSAMPCPDGVEAGGVAICECPDESIGSALCGEDMKLGECACAGSPDAGVGAGSGGTGGAAPVGSSGSGGAAPSTGGSAPPDLADAGGGMMPVDAGDMGSPPPMVVEPPTDANQQSLCEDDRDCNAGLGCYTGGGGRNFCTATCESDEDCASLSGGDFTCGTGSGLCRVLCEGADDTTSCPDGMACIESGFMFPGGGPGGGGTATCKWPEEGASPGGEAGGPYAECMMDSDCGDGLECIGGGAMSFFGSVGYCATPCQDDGDCEDQPASGGIDPTCEPNSPVSGVCALDCSGGASGDCPDGMECLETAFASRCGYN